MLAEDDSRETRTSSLSDEVSTGEVGGVEFVITAAFSPLPYPWTRISQKAGALLTIVVRREMDGIVGNGLSSVEVECLTRKRRSEEEREAEEAFRETVVVVRVEVVEVAESRGSEFLRSARLRDWV